jgi:hypothetical protein
MPNPKKNETEKEFVARCIPFLMKEGKPQKQAIAQCYSMFKQAKKNTKGEAVNFDDIENSPAYLME